MKIILDKGETPNKHVAMGDMDRASVVVGYRDDGTLKVYKHRHLPVMQGTFSHDRQIYQASQLNELLEFTSGKCPEYTVEPDLVITISGPAASGKSTVAALLSKYLLSVTGSAVNLVDDTAHPGSTASFLDLKHKHIQIVTQQTAKKAS